MASHLVMLHGWLGDPADFGTLAAALEPDLDLSAIELPGHGGLRLDERSTTDAALDDVADRIAEAVGGRDYVLGGYSLGGRLAAWLAATGRVGPHGLVLIAASPGLAGRTERTVRLTLDQERANELRQGRFAEFLDSWYRLPLFADLRHRPDFPQLLERRLRRDPLQAARALELLSVGLQPDLSRHDFDCEVLYIAGAQDRKYSDQGAGWTGSRAVLVPGAGHAVHLEQPEAIARAIREMECLS